jgi:hypothetical protein
MTSKFADHVKAATFNGDWPNVEIFRRALLDAAAELPVSTHARILDHLVTAGLASNDAGALHAGAGSKPQLGEHFATLSAYATGGETRPVLFALRTVAQARQEASVKGQDAWFGGLMNRLRRVGHKVDVDAPVDNVELTRCLRASGMSIESRMELRTMLSAAGILEP